MSAISGRRDNGRRTGRQSLLRSLGRYMPARQVVALMMQLAPIATAGCVWNAPGPRTIPLHLRDADTGVTISGAVVVSIVRSTGWYPYLTIESEDHPADRVRIAKIARVDASHPTVYLPHHLAGAGSQLGLIIGEGLEVRVFSPGYQQGYPEAIVDGQLSEWDYTESVYEDGAALQVTMRRLRPNRTAATRPGAKIESSPASAPDAAPSGKELGGRQFQQAYRHELGEDPLWRELRRWYFWGRKRDEIQTICKSVVESAEAFQNDNPQYKWTPAEEEVLDWCKRVASGKP